MFREHELWILVFHRNSRRSGYDYSCDFPFLPAQKLLRIIVWNCVQTLRKYIKTYISTLPFSQSRAGMNVTAEWGTPQLNPWQSGLSSIRLRFTNHPMGPQSLDNFFVKRDVIGCDLNIYNSQGMKLPFISLFAGIFTKFCKYSKCS